MLTQGMLVRMRDHWLRVIMKVVTVDVSYGLTVLQDLGSVTYKNHVTHVS